MRQTTAMRLNSIVKWLAAVLLGVPFAILSAGALFYYWDFPGYCSRLEARVRDPEVQQAIRLWVAENWNGEPITIQDLQNADGVVPGDRWLSADFDGKVLGMGDRAHVRLLGDRVSLLIEDRISENVQAVYFTERSRFGVVYQLDGRKSYSKGGSDLRPISQEFSLICMLE